MTAPRPSQFFQSFHLAYRDFTRVLWTSPACYLCRPYIYFPTIMFLSRYFQWINKTRYVQRWSRVKAELSWVLMLLQLEKFRDSSAG